MTCCAWEGLLGFDPEQPFHLQCADVVALSSGVFELRGDSAAILLDEVSTFDDYPHIIGYRDAVDALYEETHAWCRPVQWWTWVEPPVEGWAKWYDKFSHQWAQEP